MKRMYLIGALGAVTFFTQALSASVLGTLTEANCSGGGVTVTWNSISWLPPIAGPGGCIDSATPTAVTYGTGGLLTMGAGATGELLNITTTSGSAVPSFMTFAAGSTPQPANTLSWTLTGVSAGDVANENCTGLALFASCSPNLGAGVFSPFILTNEGGGNVNVALNVTMSIVDPVTGQTTNWTGIFGTQLTGTTAAAVQATICPTEAAGCVGGGSITNAQGGTFQAVVAPEPGTIAMMLTGGLLLAASRKRKAKI